MALKKEERSGDRYSVLTACPVCGTEFDVNSGEGRVAHFRNEHTPEDFGL